MFDFNLFLKGILVGFSIAAPVGPIGILCINRTLTSGRKAGFISGLGAATADTLYGIAGGLGVSFVATLVNDHKIMLRVIGGVILVFFGARIFITKPLHDELEITLQSLVKDYFSTFILTLTNPLTFVAFAAIFAGLGIHMSGSRTLLSGITLIAGIFTGSITWWFLLSFFVGMFHNSFSHAKLVAINKFSGIIIMVFGLAILFELLLRVR